MRGPVRLAPPALLGAGILLLGAGIRSPGADPGIPVTSEAVIRSCSSCHAVDAEGRMSRISYMRKTPEGWQASLQRMVALQEVRLDPETAREIVRYLSNRLGLAPGELAPARFEVERRMVDFRYPEEATRETCAACHSMGVAMTQRRTREEWELLAETHRGYYPRIDGQRFRRGGAPPGEHPVDRAIEHLSRTYPFETAEWAEWSAAFRPPRLEGSWALKGTDPGRGPVFGRMEVAAVPGTDDEFTTRTTYVYAEDGETVEREGRAIVYTGYQWRGRSGEGTPPGSGAPRPPEMTGVEGELREVLLVDRSRREMDGRWFTGPHDEFGIDVTLLRIGSDPVPTGVHPVALRPGEGEVELTVHGENLPRDAGPAELDLGPGVEVVRVVEAGPDRLVARVRVAPGAEVGYRDLALRDAVLPRALVVYDRVDRLEVKPRAGMARIGGIAVPKQYQQFEAVAYHAGPDGEPGTEDDLRIGRVPVEWDLLEYPVTFEDDDVEYVGTIDGSGLFTPAVDGPNPDRPGDRNNMGDVWVRARHTPPGGEAGVVEGRAYLLVTAPLYIRWDAWSPGEEGPR